VSLRSSRKRSQCVNVWIVAAKCLGMIGGISMSLACGRNRSGGLVTEIRRQAVPEDGCGNWK